MIPMVKISSGFPSHYLSSLKLYLKKLYILRTFVGDICYVDRNFITVTNYSINFD